MSVTITWESQRISQSSAAAHLGMLRESCASAAAACGLLSNVRDGVLMQTPEGTAITLSEGSGLNALSPTDLSGGGVLTMPDDHGLLLCLLHVSAVFGKTFKLDQEPQIQFCDEEGRLLLPAPKRDWDSIAEVLISTGMPELLVDGYLRRVAITLKLAGEPLDIQSDRIPDAFF